LLSIPTYQRIIYVTLGHGADSRLQSPAEWVLSEPLPC
jgi:hypothetical protein